MLKLLNFLWTGCWHEWAEHRRGPYTRKDDFGGYREGAYVIYSCAKCGRLRQETSV